MRTMPQQAQTPFSGWDLIFLLLAAGYAWLACRGIVEMSGAGAMLDSDLQTYAQGMAGAALPDKFANDPVLHAPSPANSIPNIERMLGVWLAPQQEWATGLLRSGAIAIFVFYAGWYFLGRWLYQSAALSALLAVVCGITIWTGWGTFWGISHSDPVPRVFFGAIMPFLLLLAFVAINRPFLRPIAMLASGLAIWAHGVSALNCGAMIFMAFLFIPANGMTFSRHLVNLCMCLIAFFVPVAFFLWPSLSQNRSFSPADLAFFQEMFDLRWHEDYGNFSGRLWKFLSPAGHVFPVLAGGICGWCVAMYKGVPREKLLCRVAPCFLVALFLVVCFSWLETRFAQVFGRLPMGHELVRGMRLLVPLAWMLIVAGVGCLAGKVMRRVILFCAVIAVLGLSHDRQYVAAQYAASRLAGVAPVGASEAREAAAMRQLMMEVRKIVPAGESVYCPEDAMQVRYLAQRPLVHSFKDGYVHFYNKDVDRSREWLKLEKLARSGPNGYLEAWLASGAPWLLCRDNADKASIEKLGEIVFSRDGWLLARVKK